MEKPFHGRRVGSKPILQRYPDETWADKSSKGEKVI